MTVVRDVTESRVAQQRLKDLDRRKDEFLATGRFCRASLVWNDPSRLVQLRGVMERQVEQLRRLIDDLLDVSRVSRGKIELQLEPTEIASVLDRAIESVGPIIEAHRHELVCEIPPETLKLRGDPGRLVQVFGNLIHNAAKYTPSHGRIRINEDSLGFES